MQGYELLFRESSENRYTSQDPDLASKRTMDTAVLVGLDILSEGCSMFLNCTEEFIVQGYATLFPAELTVLEVLESVDPNEKVLSALRELKAAGYRIALDDFVDQPKLAPLVELADIIKVDFRTTPPATRLEVVKRYATHERRLLAEKVETDEEFADAVQMGFSLFQGFFFCKPNMLSAERVPVLPDTHLRIERALAPRWLDLIEIEQLIKSEPALCYRLLRYLNSPVFYLQNEIESILHALALLGESELRKWLLLMSAVVSGDGESNSMLIAAALSRAHFAELLAPFTASPSSELFLTSLFSIMDAVVNRPLPIILQEVVLPEEVFAALAGEANELGQCNQLVIAYERADWAGCDQWRRHFHIPESELRDAYLEAVGWAGRLTNANLAVLHPIPAGAVRQPYAAIAAIASYGGAPPVNVHRHVG